MLIRVLVLMKSGEHRRRVEELLAADGVPFESLGVPDDLWQRLQSDERHRNFEGRKDPLDRLSALLTKNRAQRFMTLDQLVQSMSKRRKIEHAVQSHGKRHRIGRASGFQLFKEPETLLGERQR